MAYVYIVRCDDGSLYTGITNDLEKRMKNHLDGSGTSHAKYMRSHKPIEIVTVWRTEHYKVAAKLEYAIKRLKRAEKIKLISNPDSVTSRFPALCEYVFEPLSGITLENCLDGTFFGKK
ncbi:MAG: GIY-YIG nuclease family protein [Clostridia bacterium]|nr:GIY-YIG nuclease family protein [Clostridia bacterium]